MSDGTTSRGDTWDGPDWEDDICIDIDTHHETFEYDLYLNKADLLAMLAAIEESERKLKEGARR